ncbi:hypothetical protein B0H14DRAFT_2392344 [Mycena olivaceomarginata]|nr:hypothetical protein B0H14DRAFT_2392344 [Mycena olivaceomarginata]
MTSGPALTKSLGHTPPSAVRALTNSNATRSAIITAFKEHLIYNSDISPGDTIIIYYAGHGGRVRAPADWRAPSGMVETLCPADQACGVVPGIPDVTINALLSSLAQKKGTNITFVCDSCHSGGVTRNSEDDQNFVRRGITVDILDKDLDSQIRQRSTNEAVKVRVSRQLFFPRPPRRLRRPRKCKGGPFNYSTRRLHQGPDTRVAKICTSGSSSELPRILR